MSNTIIFVMMTASIMSRSDFENSQISPKKHTVGIAGDDIMYYILVGLGARTFPAKLQQNYYQQNKTQG